MKRYVTPFFLVQLLCYSAAAQLSFETRVLKDSLFIPWELVYGPDNHLWFTQKNGYICRMDTAGIHTDTLYHEPSTVTIKETGMLGMALHPDFAANPYVYVVWEYLNPAGSFRERIERYTYSPGANTLGAPLVLLDSTSGFRFHNGSRIVIAGDKLFVTIADAANTANPQNLNTINGKIIRLNLDGSIPADNPIPGSPIWSWGHRNPQGLVYANGILFSSEHGPDTDDEINLIEKGRNYGWPVVRGFCDQTWETQFCIDSNVREPLWAWTPTIAPCGLDYYHHPMFPSLGNSLLLATLKDKHLYQLKLNEAMTAITDVSVIAGFDQGRLRDLCISPEGKIFVSTSNSDPNDTGAKTDRIVMLCDPAFHKDHDRFSVYPNPVKDYVHFFVPSAYNWLRIIISSADGRRYADTSATGTTSQVPVTDYPPGMYNIAIVTDYGDIFRGRFIKNK